MKHVILTRFNVMMPGWNSPIRLDPDWLNNRFELFEILCLPSIVNQTIRDFEWFVYFDSQTPDKFKRQIEILQAKYPFKSIFVDIFDIREISKHLSDTFKEHDFLLTSRLDSDDLLANAYVEELHRVVYQGPFDKRVVNFDNGAILLQKSGKNYLYDYHDNSSPFSSLLEPNNNDLLTILSVNHTTLHQHFDVVNVTGQPMWLQVVHGGNVSNIVRGKRVAIEAFNANFYYLKRVSSSTRESFISLKLDQLLFGHIRFIRDHFRLLLKRTYYFFKKV